MSREYYYLIASLPQLRLDDYKEPYRVNEFVAELEEHLLSRHRRYVRDLLCAYDNVHIVEALLERPPLSFARQGNWTYEYIKASVHSLEDATDPYLEDIARRFSLLKKEKESFSRGDVERLVATAYYEKMLCHENKFIRRYCRFDFLLRNILLALNARKNKQTAVEFLSIGQDDLIDQLGSSSQNDFGISRDFDYLSRLMEAFAQDDLIYTEKVIDEIRWQTVEDITLFNYFEIDVLLGYLIKLMLVERWIFLDEHKGQDVFSARTQVMDEIISRAN